MDHINETNDILDLLKRHYPSIAEPYITNNIGTAFAPLYGPEKWEEAIESGVVDKEIVDSWADAKERNEEYFENLDDDDIFFDSYDQGRDSDLAFESIVGRGTVKFQTYGSIRP